MTATRHPHLNRVTWEKNKRALGKSMEERAKRIGVKRETLSRILSGARHPGGEFIHGLMSALPWVPYLDMFVDEEAQPLWPGIHARCC